jgi:hypothetical protein
MRSALIIVIFSVLLTPLITSCKKNHYRINTSSVDVKLEVRRLERDLFTMNPDGIVAAVPELKKKYGDFLQLFSYVINTGDINDPSFGDFLVRFCTDKLNNEVYTAVMKQYPDVSGIERDLQEAFRHYRYYFPRKKLPAVFTCITGFNNSIITGDSILGISLDRYLGADCEYYKRLDIYKYLTARMTPGNIIPDCIYGWATSEWDISSFNYHEDNVLTEIIHEGKLKYFEKCMLPEVPDDIIFGFTPDQFKFCHNNENQMWQYLIEKNILFSTDQFTIRKVVGEAPFTSFFTNESPGRAAVWIGFRIVESYMLNDQATTLDDLMKETDIQKILEKARYNPK